MAHQSLSILLPLMFLGILSAQTYGVGDTIPDFTAPICANGEGTFSLYDYNGAVNGGDYSVVWITFLASW